MELAGRRVCKPPQSFVMLHLNDTEASTSGRNTATMQKLPSPLLHSHNFWSFSSTSENHNHIVRSVTFQKWLRLVSLEIPEPGATKYQNLMRQNPNLTRSRATKFCLSPIRRRISKKAGGSPERA
jgi:hypothetical protein